jgi:hypothetical protein
MTANVCSENLAGRGNLGNLGVGGRIILDWILEKQGAMMRTEFILLRIWTNKQSNGPSDSIKVGDFLKT